MKPKNNLSKYSTCICLVETVAGKLPKKVKLSPLSACCFGDSISSESDSMLVIIAFCRDFVNDFDLGFNFDLSVFFLAFNFDFSFFFSADFDFLAFFNVLLFLRFDFKLVGLV